jgi:hypothetical protein
MPLTASQLLDQRFTGDKAELQSAFEHEWALVSNRFGPVTRNPAVEEVRRRALLGLHQEYAGRADTLLKKYNEKMRGFSEVDQMAQQGMLSSDPEEVKFRMSMDPDVERAAFPKETREPTFEQLETRRSKIRTELNQFELGRMEGEEFKTDIGTLRASKHPGPKFWPLRGGTMPGWFRGEYTFDIPAQGVYAKERYIDNEGKTQIRHRPATPEEMHYYAELKQGDVNAARLQTAALRSTRMLNRGQGTFAQKAVTPAEAGETRTVQGRIFRKVGPDQWELVE